jgi:hypothetical protein
MSFIFCGAAKKTSKNQKAQKETFFLDVTFYA